MAQSSLGELWSVPGNSHCVDCGVPEPDWASINLGVMVCLDCSGIHRQLGVHISQVRSVKLDTKCWQGELMDHMRSIGNLAFNKVWEGGIPPETIRPGEFPNFPAVREAFILAKYRDHRFFLNAESEGVVDMASRIPRGQDVVFESDVVKLSGATLFGKPKWDSRTLRLGDGKLDYLCKGTVKGSIPLEGCTFSLLDDDTYAGQKRELHGGRWEVCDAVECRSVSFPNWHLSLSLSPPPLPRVCKATTTFWQCTHPKEGRMMGGGSCSHASQHRSR